MTPPTVEITIRAPRFTECSTTFHLASIPLLRLLQEKRFRQLICKTEILSRQLVRSRTGVFMVGGV